MSKLGVKIAEGYKGMVFDEGPHTYKVKDKFLTPVSTVIEEFAEEFDEELWAERVGRKEGKSKEEILLLWQRINKQACDLGHDVHTYAEKYAYHLYYDKPKPYRYSHEVQKEAAEQFYAELDNKYFPVALELQMYHEGYGIAGTCDVLLYNEDTKKFVLADWKTNADIYKNYQNKTLMPPFQYTLDNPNNHYQIQLSLYQILLELKNWTVEERWIMWLRPTGGYELHKTFDFTGILKPYLDDRRRSNRASTIVVQ